MLLDICTISASTNLPLTDCSGRGGSLVADFLASNNALIQKQHFFAAVRSEEQAKAISSLGVNVLQLDLADETAVTNTLLKYESMCKHCYGADGLLHETVLGH